MSISSEDKARLIAVAEAATRKAYAPFSGFRVGAAILTESGNIFEGCNVENQSYGLTICAERTAIVSAVAAQGGEKMRIRAIAIVNEDQTPCSPCGACRQFIWEFGRDAIVLFYDSKGLQESSIRQLLPHAFSFD
ncbi:cytidine deaminase [Oscillatoria sp. FACHB-1406]|uniref:cytidine deaminase n=1 Tax=Oscillatoria sp. FACHB-1406 TaxID=2692846 RepID=UPI0016889C34|nr:cytidine deaminase [Oscillatoria sp. FACHB-1406]MBD2579014.1 cytidine deaminase [Oscillatoria sp. FACHB-1406]